MTTLLELPRQRAATAASPAPQRTHWRLALLTAVVVAVAVRLVGLADGPAYTDDEGTYVAQAWAVVDHGALAHYTYWYDHPPLGWLVLALWDVLTPWSTATAVLEGRQLMVLLSAVDAALLVVLARRLGLRWQTGLAAGLLWGLSPLAVSYGRGVWLDNVALPLALGALACALSPRRHLWAYAGSGALIAAAVLAKETSVLLLPAVVLGVARTSAGRTRPFCLAAFGSTAVLVLAAYPLLALLKGELLPGPDHVSLLDAVDYQLHGRASTGSPLDATSGSAALVRQWLAVDPWLLSAGVLVAPAALALRRLRIPAVALLVPVVVGLRPGYLPEPYVAALLPFAALLVAGLVERLPWRVPLAAALVAVLAVVWTPTTWALGDQDATARTVAVEDWIAANVPHDDRLLVDDSVWVDLVDRGFDPHLGVVWFYKTDFTGGLDPSVRRAFPDGYRDLQWVVVSPILRSALAKESTGLTEVRAAVQHSTLVHTSGTGDGRFEVRRIDPEDPS